VERIDSDHIEIVSRYFVGGTEEDYEKPQNTRCSGRNSNPAPPRYKSRALPLCRSARLGNKVLYCNNWLTTWGWAFLEKPPVAQLLKNFPAFYGTLKVNIIFTRVCMFVLPVGVYVTGLHRQVEKRTELEWVRIFPFRAFTPSSSLSYCSFRADS
jgi:hypothetical protein